MASKPFRKLRAAAIWGGLLAAIAIPVVLASVSPLLQWRDPIYVLAGFAGILSLGLMLAQPLLAAGVLPGFRLAQSRRIHAFLGAVLVLGVIVHVAGLWVTSPPDVIDALLFMSPTPFAIWGVAAMWALFGAAILAVLKSRARLSPRLWRMGHATLVSIAVVGTAIHALLIEGAMEPASKIALVAIVVLVSIRTIVKLRIFAPRRRPHSPH